MSARREIHNIPVNKIDILNPRQRNRKVFQELVESIRALGLKKPITVTPRPTGDGERYSLVCGQGRLEAMTALGQTRIPALIVEASDEDALVMSLVENIARRNPRPREMLEAIRILKNRGYEITEISRKTALDHTWIRGILTLLEKGEERLISAVEAGRVPIATAIEIVRAGDDDAQIQAVMQSAYESGALRGKKLLTVRKLIEKRRLLGKAHQKGGQGRHITRQVSSSSLIRAYNQEVERQKLLIRKADFAQTRLAFVTAAMGTLLADENIINLLRAEGLDTLPKPLAEKIRVTGIDA